ncbi:unnamed protein product, partial [marine sediment metagenome]
APFPAVYSRDKAGSFSSFGVSNLQDIAGWQRGSNVYDAATGAVANRTGIGMAATSAPWAVHIWGVQSELGSFGSSHIETDGAAATRLADDLSIDSADIPASFLTEPWTVSVQMPMSAEQAVTEGANQTIFHMGGSDRLVFTGGAGAFRHCIVVIDGVFIQASSNTWDPGDVLHITCDPIAGSLVVVGPSATVRAISNPKTGWPVATDLDVG